MPVLLSTAHQKHFKAYALIVHPWTVHCCVTSVKIHKNGYRAYQNYTEHDYSGISTKNLE